MNAIVTDGSYLRPTYGDIKVLWEINLFLPWIQGTQNRARRLIGSLILEIALDRRTLDFSIRTSDDPDARPQPVFMIEADDHSALVGIELNEASERVDTQHFDGDFDQIFVVSAFGAQHKQLANGIVRQQRRAAIPGCDQIVVRIRQGHQLSQREEPSRFDTFGKSASILKFMVLRDDLGDRFGE